jgi:hypothetical protein
MAPELGPFPADSIFDVACISHLYLCTALHFTTLHYTTSCVSSRTGRTSISTSNYQHVRSVKSLVAYSVQRNAGTLLTSRGTVSFQQELCCVELGQTVLHFQ